MRRDGWRQRRRAATAVEKRKKMAYEEEGARASATPLLPLLIAQAAEPRGQERGESWD